MLVHPSTTSDLEGMTYGFSSTETVDGSENVHVNLACGMLAPLLDDNEQLDNLLGILKTSLISHPQRRSSSNLQAYRQ